MNSNRKKNVIREELEEREELEGYPGLALQQERESLRLCDVGADMRAGWKTRRRRQDALCSV